jgi:predicted NBD/HSP70 family sugar kinase
MSFPAVSSNAKRLLEADYIIEVGVGENNIGRKSTLLAFNAERGYIIGIDLGRFRIRMMLADLLGNEVACAEIDSKTIFSGDRKKSIQLIEEQIRNILINSSKNGDDVLCIVIGVPGVIKDGESFLAPFAEKFSEKEIVETLQNTFEADVLLENNVNLGVIGEQWKGAGVNYKNIIYISYGVGFGSAHIVDGKLYKGANGAAGEIGFMITDPMNISKRYDEVGSLEEALTISKINNYLKFGNFDEKIIKLIQSYENGEEKYAELILDEISLNLGIALVNMAALMNPEAIIIAGGLGYNIGKLFIEEWKEVLCNHLPFVPEILLSELNHTETMLGAVMTGIIHTHKYKF